jgi:hypothetical protein
MSGVVALRSWVAGDRRTTATRRVELPQLRRGLQLCLAGLWLLDGVLQLQAFMFTKGFARQVLAPSATANPAVIATPINSAARLVAAHSVGANTVFALTQILLGLGIACRPTVKAALTASIGWALAVWWLGEGLGGVLTGHAGPLAGGPGAAVIYALLAVLLWPPSPAAAAQPSFVAAGAIGSTRARLVWLLVWGSLAGFALQGANRSAQGAHDLIAGMAAGQPPWLAAIDNHIAVLVASRGLGVAIGLAVVCAAIALAAFGPPAMARAAVVAAGLLAVVIWVGAQALGAMFGGQGTDPNTGPLFIVLALAYWPLAQTRSDETATPC